MYNSQIVAIRIKNLAKINKIIIKDMLDECGLSKNALSSMNAGGSMPKSENLAKIADYLNCSVDYLLGRTDEPQGITQINTGDVGNNSSVNINKNNSDDELVSLINSLSLLDRSKVVLFIDELKQNENND